MLEETSLSLHFDKELLVKIQNDATEVTTSLVVTSHMNHILATSSVEGYGHAIGVL